MRYRTAKAACRLSPQPGRSLNFGYYLKADLIESWQRDAGRPMRYSTGEEMAVGDEVVADGMCGIIVCNFDNRLFAEGYADWDMPTVKTVGGTRSSGVMIDTKEAGLIHYRDGTGEIKLLRAPRG